MGIDSKDLRIGNYVNDDEHQVVRIELIQSDLFFEFNGCDEYPLAFTFEEGIKSSKVYGIPITETWLLKLGATFYNDSGYYKNYMLPNKIGISMALKDIPEGYGDKKGSFYIGENNTEIKTVHQLQNFIYFVYGVELEVKS